MALCGSYQCGCGLTVGAGLSLSGSGESGDPWELNLDGFGTLTAWTPSLTASTTNPTLGTGSTQYGRYMLLNGLLFAWWRIIFGSSGVNAGSGTYRLDGLPFALLTGGVLGGAPIGTVRLTDDSNTGAGRNKIGSINAGLGMVTHDNAVATVGAGVPWTWAAGDEIRGFLVCPIA